MFWGADPRLYIAHKWGGIWKNAKKNEHFRNILKKKLENKK